MLKDLRELGKNDKTFFSEIKEWPEVSFNDEDKQKLCEIDTHIITFFIEPKYGLCRPLMTSEVYPKLSKMISQPCICL